MSTYAVHTPQCEGRDCTSPATHTIADARTPGRVHWFCAAHLVRAAHNAHREGITTVTYEVI